MDAAETGKEFGRIGRRLFTAGLLSANFGNMSVRSGNGFFITRTGSFLDVPEQPVYVPLEGPGPGGCFKRVQGPPGDLYDNLSPCRCPRPPAPRNRSLTFTCPNYPGRYGRRHVLPVIPVVEGKPGSEDLAVNVARSLLSSCVAVARGHGTFAGGKNLDEAYIRTSLAEHSCRILILIGKSH